MSVQTLILHIGQSKTGTSSIQSFLSQNRAQLRAGGVLYPDVIQNGVAVHLNEHNAFAESLSGIQRYPWLSAQEYRDSFLSQMKAHKCDTLLLSAESFFGTPQIWTVEDEDDFFEQHAHKIEQLKELFQPERCEVIVYLRRQDQWLESAVGHIIRYEGLLDQDVYTDDEQVAEFLMPHMQYLKLLDLWQNGLKPNAMHVTPYERKALKGKDAIADFVSRLSLDKDVKSNLAPLSVKENESWSAEVINLKRELNKRNKNKIHERVTIDIINDLCKDTTLPFSRFHIEQALKAKILTKSASTNKKIADIYCEKQALFSIDKTSKNVVSVLPEEQLEVLQAFEVRYYSVTYSVQYLFMLIKNTLRSRFSWLYNVIKILVGCFKKKVKA